MDQLKLNDIADDLLIMNRWTVETLFRLDNCADCIALYSLYYKTAKWQKTNTVRANDLYVKKCLKWGIDRIKKTKQTLKEHGLIDIVQRRKDGKIEGWYIQVSYLVSQRKTEEIEIKVEESKNTQNQQVENSTSGFEDTNALKEKIKCLESKIKMLEKKEDVSSEVKKEFEELWDEYPRKQGHKKALEAYIKARKDGVDKDTVLDGIRAYKAFLTANKTNSKYIKQGSTWFNQKCWEDDYNIEPGMAAKRPINNDFDYLEEMEEERMRKALKLYREEEYER